MYIDDFLRRIEGRIGSRPKRVSSGYSCRCPAHDDKNPSLSISAASGGKILMKCHAGCTIEEICKALDLQVSDLFPNEEKRQSACNEKTEYIYTSENGNLLYKKVRTPEKQFYILSWSQTGTWEKGLKGDKRVLYQLPEVIVAKKNGKTSFLDE